MPLWKLLGGTGVERFPLYSTDAGWLSFPQADMIAKMQAALAAGFHGVKMKIGSPDPVADLRRVAAVREAIGPEAALMVDINTHWDLSTALRWGPELDQFTIGWLEEPMNQHDVKGHAQLQALMKRPVARGREPDLADALAGLHRAAGAAPGAARRDAPGRHHSLARCRCDGPCQLDPGRAGGAGTLMQVSIHMAAATPEVHLMEHLDWTLDIFEERLAIEDGWLAVPTGPWVGCTVRADVVERVSGRVGLDRARERAVLAEPEPGARNLAERREPNPADRAAAVTGPALIREQRPTTGEALTDVHLRSWRWAYTGLIPDSYIDELWSHRAERIERTRARLSEPRADEWNWLAERDGTVVGLAMTWASHDADADASTGEVAAIYLAPEAAGQGIGRQLFAHAVAELRVRGVSGARRCGSSTPTNAAVASTRPPAGGLTGMRRSRSAPAPSCTRSATRSNFRRPRDDDRSQR